MTRFTPLRSRFKLLGRIGILFATVILNKGSATAAVLDIRLLDGKGYPACVAMAGALRHMSPSTGLAEWPDHLPPMVGISKPAWTELDALQNLTTIQDFVIEAARQSHDERSAQAIWAEEDPKIERAIKAKILLLEETTVRNVKFGGLREPLTKRPWTTDIRFVRIGWTGSADATITSHRRFDHHDTVWAMMAGSFSLFPNIHNIPIEGGSSGTNLLLIGQQPWFVLYGVIGPLYAANFDPTGANPEPLINIDQTCLISFPD